MFTVDQKAPLQLGQQGVGQLHLEDKHEITFREVRSAESLNPHHRIVRLEKSIAWLKEQHGQMVAGLHNEIETLKHRNRGESGPAQEEKRSNKISNGNCELG